MTDIHTFLAAGQGKRILILGDLMVDRYLWGKVERISPEAPVPVVDISREENRLGGAANVALNLRALGAAPVLCGAIGADAEGESFCQLLHTHHFDDSLLLHTPERRTTVKVRIIGNQQQMLRVDKEDRSYLSSLQRQEVLKLLAPRLQEFDALVFQDYDKGFLHPTFIAEVMQLAQQHGLPVVVDPKFQHFWAYAHCQLFKPNLKELNEALNLRLQKNELEALARAVAQLRSRMPHRHTLVTLSEAGMLLLDEHMQPLHLPAHYRQITDVSGAGDTVLSLMALGMAAGFSPAQSMYFANLAGGLVCEEVGVVPVNRHKLVAEAERVQQANLRTE